MVTLYQDTTLNLDTVENSINTNKCTTVFWGSLITGVQHVLATYLAIFWKSMALCTSQLICLDGVEWKQDVMAHAQKPVSVFQRNGQVHLYRRGCQFSRVLAFLEWGSEENDCSNTGWTVPSQTENCWLPTPFVSFPFTSPVCHRVPSDSVSTLLHFTCAQHPIEDGILHNDVLSLYFKLILKITF